MNIKEPSITLSEIQAVMESLTMERTELAKEMIQAQRNQGLSEALSEVNENYISACKSYDRAWQAGMEALVNSITERINNEDKR